MSAPLVSVLMTSYNREKYIEDAIESVLSSTFRDFELIVVDDGSSDRTVEIARSYEKKDGRVKVYQNEKNLGDYHNRNKAASYASGRYLKYIDSDDMIYPYGLQVYVEAMEKYPDTALAVSSRNDIPMEPFPIYLSSVKAYNRHFFEYGILDYGPSGVMIRRSCFEECGGFSGKRYVGDQELWLKLAARHPVVELPPSLVFWRQHEGQEFKLGLDGIDKGYFMMNLPLIREALADPACPLTDGQKQSILKLRNKQYVRTLVKHALFKGEWRKAWHSFRILKLSVKDIF